MEELVFIHPAACAYQAERFGDPAEPEAEE